MLPQIIPRTTLRPFSGSINGYLTCTIKMSRRSLSTSPAPEARAPKRVKVDHLTSESFKDGVFLAPMVRSGALPTRLMCLKYGATLVWGPEMVDKAMLHAERMVDPVTGVISYNGKQERAMFTTHPIEKPYFIFQVGSGDPELAVQAAKVVQQDISGVELNCGCPKPFSTDGGFGAQLLTDPDRLCAILTALREAMPPEITVTAKIRLLPSQEDTLKLVERIVNTGVAAITIHCRTKNMRKRERALTERLREIVDFVERMGKGIPVVGNGDCLGLEDAKRFRMETGASSVMIATAAECNPSCFSDSPLVDIESTFTPSYIQLCQYFNHYFGLTKFCTQQFKAQHINFRKPAQAVYRQTVSSAKSYDDLLELAGGSWNGKEVFDSIARAIQARTGEKPLALCPKFPDTVEAEAETPQQTQNPEPPTLNAPKEPVMSKVLIPAMISGTDPLTPTPGGVSIPVA